MIILGSEVFAGLRRTPAFLTILSLLGCAQVPAEPGSVYFSRLLALVSTQEHGTFDLLNPRVPDDDANIAQRLLGDGFEATASQASHPELYETLTCSGIRYSALRGHEEEGYSRRFVWGGAFVNPPFTSYVIDVAMSSNCDVVRISGFKWRNVL